MDITKFDFPALSDVEIAFSSVVTNKALLDEAIKRGFYNGRTKYNDLFMQLFYRGGKLNLKPGLDESFKAKAIPYLKAFMMSFEPKHEEKAAISALLLSELVD